MSVSRSPGLVLDLGVAAQRRLQQLMPYHHMFNAPVRLPETNLPRPVYTWAQFNEIETADRFAGLNPQEVRAAVDA